MSGAPRQSGRVNFNDPGLPLRSPPGPPRGRRIRMRSPPATSLEGLENTSTRLFASSARLATFLKDASLAELGGSRLIVQLQPSREPLGITMASEPNDGARICTVGKGSRAEEAGLRGGDRIERINGQLANGAMQAKELIEWRAGGVLKLEIVRPRHVQKVATTKMLERRVLPCGPQVRRVQRGRLTRADPQLHAK